MIAPQLDRVSSALSLWHRYDPEVRADLFSTVVTTEEGLRIFVDPTQPPPAFEPPGAIVLTNANHVRAAATLAADQSLPIYARAGVHLPDRSVTFLEGRQEIAPGLVVIAIEGAAPGEIALFHRGEGGTLILGDALIHMDSHGFTFLPAKYCENQKQMRRSLLQLLEFSCERILFAHGTPIVTQARDRLERLLTGRAATADE